MRELPKVAVMTHQQKTDAKWNIGVIVTVVLAAFGLSTQIGRYQQKVDSLLEAKAEEKREQAALDAGQNGRLGTVENRATALETEQRNLRGEQDRMRSEMNRLPAFANKYNAGVGN